MRRLLALALYLFIGLPAILGTLFLVPARGWVLDRDFYKAFVSGPEARAVLESPALYERFEATIQAGDTLKLSGPATGKALKASLPVPELLSAAGSAVDSVFDSLEQRQNAGRFSMDLLPLKKALALGVPEFARVYTAEVPFAPEAALPVPTLPGTPLDLSVRSVSVPEAEFRSTIETTLSRAMAQIPDRAENTLPTPGTGIFLADSFLVPRDALNSAALWMSLLAGGMWIAGAFVASDSAGKRLRWLGSTLMAPGIVVLAAGAALRLAADPLVLSVIKDPGLQRALADPSLRVLRDWIRRPLWTISTGFLVSGSLAVILGGGLSASRKALRYRDFR